MRIIVRLAASTVLAVLGLLHLIWAVGSPFPARSATTLAEAVIGGDTMPPPGASATVGAALVTAAAVASRGSTMGMIARIGLGLAFAGRAIVGGALPARVLTGHDPHRSFLRLDARLYRPLCVVVAALSLTAVAADVRRD